MIYDHAGGIRDALKQDLALEFCRNQEKVVSILTKTHINHDLIQHKRNNWLGPIFFSPGDSHTEGMLFILHLGFEGIWGWRHWSKREVCVLKVTPFNESSLLVLLQGIASENSWLGALFWTTTKSYAK